MKAELIFKKTDWNQTPEVVTLHSDTLDVSGVELRKLIESVLAGYTTQDVVGAWVDEFEDTSLISLVDIAHTKLFGVTAEDWYHDDTKNGIDIELDNVIISGKTTVKLQDVFESRQDEIYDSDAVDEKCKEMADEIATNELE